MKPFMDEDFLLNSNIAKQLYHDYADKMPIIDYHCHINPQEIAEDRRFENIAQVWLGGDHYKWRLMRSNGVEERDITGDATDREKFQKWAETLEKAIGNPLYHWSHLELQRYFGYYGTLNGDNAGEVWNLCNEKLKQTNMSARNLIKKSKVTQICTTDDPIDSLEWHKMIADDATFDVQVRPAWRPEMAMGIDKPEFADYICKLSDISGVEINCFADLQEALVKRMEFFNEMGCVISDHSLDYVMYIPASNEEIEMIFRKAMESQSVTYEEKMKYQTAFMLFAGCEYAKQNWVMQLHYGVKRNNDAFRFQKLGADTGFDCISNYTPTSQLADFLNALAIDNHLPKTILYSLNPNDNAAIGTIIGCFQNNGICGKIQQGSAWWFNDHKTGMVEQMTSLANLGLLANFVGMLTDSRSFLSYTRHEYFRRILCNMIGEWIENGEYPNDTVRVGKMVENISYNNAIKYFNF